MLMEVLMLVGQSWQLRHEDAVLSLGILADTKRMLAILIEAFLYHLLLHWSFLWLKKP